MVFDSNASPAEDLVSEGAASRRAGWSHVVGVSDGDNLRDGLRLLVRGWWIIGLCALLGAVICFGFSLLQTPIYKSSAALYVTSATDTNSQSAYQGSLASQQRVGSYSELITSDIIVNRAIVDSGLAIEPGKAKEALSAQTTPDTVLLTVSAEDPDPQRAALLANAVSNAMTGYVTTLEKPANGGSPLAKLTVVSPAVPSSSPVSPKLVRNSVIGLLLGSLVGLIWLLLRNRLDTKIRTEDDLKSITDVTMLTSVMADGDLRGQQGVDFNAGASQTAESYRRLRSNLGFVGVDSPSRRILVTSAKPGEGKTTTSFNLAVAFAEAGSRVVLVSADLRRPAIGNWLSINEAVGLTDYLRGDLAVSEVIQPSGVGGLDVVACGSVPPNPTELLASNKAGQFFDALSSEYDFVIVDSAPILPVTDSIELTRWVDGVLVVARSGWTRRPELISALRQLGTAQVRLLGLVLNDVSASLTSPAYGYYGGGYAVAEQK